MNKCRDVILISILATDLKQSAFTQHSK